MFNRNHRLPNSRASILTTMSKLVNKGRSRANTAPALTINKEKQMTRLLHLHQSRIPTSAPLLYSFAIGYTKKCMGNTNSGPCAFLFQSETLHSRVDMDGLSLCGFKTRVTPCSTFFLPLESHGSYKPYESYSCST